MWSINDLDVTVVKAELDVLNTQYWFEVIAFALILVPVFIFVFPIPMAIGSCWYIWSQAKKSMRWQDAFLQTGNPIASERAKSFAFSAVLLAFLIGAVYWVSIRWVLHDTQALCMDYSDYVIPGMLFPLMQKLMPLACH
jgi:hypothetical protein